jgi:hypothetical protein
MKPQIYLSILSMFLISCQDSRQLDSKIISSFGEQPYITSNSFGKIAIVFGKIDSIYYSSSIDNGDSFSKPSLVANHNGLVLGYSSGPSIAITSKYEVVTAPDTLGNLNAYSRPIDAKSWSGPFRINDVEASVGENLSDIASTPDGILYCVWIDTRTPEQGNQSEHSIEKPENHAEHSSSNTNNHTIESIPEIKDDLSVMTPIGITRGELFEKIGDIPKNSYLAFHDDNEGNLYWVFLDKDKNVLKAENIEEYKNFRMRNGSREKPQGKIYFSSSQDGGKTWSKSRLIFDSPDGSVCECCKPSIISDNVGNITVMFRNNFDGSRDLHYTQSTDGGKTFSTPEKLGSGTWKLDGCPMDGGDLVANREGVLNTIWQRNGEIYTSNSSLSEKKIGSGRSPSISSNNQKTYIIFSQGENILTTNSGNSTPIKIGTGSSPKVIALKNGALYFWVNLDGINFKKVI